MSPAQNSHSQLQHSCLSGHLLLLVSLVTLLSISTTVTAQSPEVKQIEQKIATLNLDGAKLMVKGDFEGAVTMIKEALELSEKNFGADDPLTALSLTTLGRAYTNKGDYEAAKVVLFRAIKIFENSPFDSRDGTAQCKLLLAIVYDYQSDYSRAQPLYEQSLVLSEAVFGPESRVVAQVLNNLANLYMQKADYVLAAQMFERSLAIRKKVYGPDHPLLIVVLNNLASVYEWQGNAVRAEELFKQAAALAGKAAPNSIGYAEILTNLGAFYRKTDPKKARALLEEGLALREKLLGPDSEDVGNSLNNLALLDWQDGSTGKAEQELIRALAIMQKTLGPAHPDASRVLSNLAMLYAGLGQPKRAVSLLLSGNDNSDRNLELMLATGSEDQKRLYMATLADATSAMVSLHLKSDPDDPIAARLALTRVLRRKGRVLDVMSGQLAAVEKSDIVGQALLFKLGTVRTQLSSLALQGAEDGNVEEYQASLLRLQDQVQSLEKMITERVIQAGGSGGSLTIEDVQKEIPAGAALVEIIQYRPVTITPISLPKWESARYAAYVLHKTGAPAWVDIGEALKIDQAATRLRSALRNPRRNDGATLSREVDELVMKPIRPLLGDSREVLLSPDGVLNLVPFAALKDENNHYLIENYSITYLTSGRDLLRMKTPVASRQGPVIIANPRFSTGNESSPKDANVAALSQRSADFNGKFEPLEGTASEAKQLSLVLPNTKVFAGADATESALRGLTGPTILHIATHGFFLNRQTSSSSVAAPPSSRVAAYESVSLVKENPLLRSGLALTGANQLSDGRGDDGILTALEAAGLDLHGTKLVVLSACETGVGEVQNGEGVYGLRRALVLAGAESELISLWKVDDEATRDLMVDFYKRLESGKSRAVALREVQIKLLKTEGYQHPFFWAGFILSGDWGAVKISE